MRVSVWEHKSTSEDVDDGSSYWKRLLIDPQCSTYLLAAKSLGHDALRVDYDVIRKPGQEPLRATPPESRKYTKPTKKDPISRLYANQRDRDETPDEFFFRVLEVIKEDPDRYYRRAPIVRLEDELREAQYDMWNTALAIRDAVAANVWPRNPDACMQWSRACDFLDVCAGMADAEDPYRFERRDRSHEELKNVEESTVVNGKRHLRLVTQSSLRTYRACPRRYYYRYEMRIQPLRPKARVLVIGTSLHRALEVWWKTGDPTKTLAAIVTTDPHDAAKERAIMIGYMAMWPELPKVISVEQQFEIDLVNPATGARSRTFRVGGAMDVIAEVA